MSTKPSLPQIYIDGSFLTRPVTGLERFALEVTAELDRLSKRGELCLVVPCGQALHRTFSNLRIEEYRGMFSGQLWSILSFSHYVKSKGGFGVDLCSRPVLGVRGLCCIHDILFRREKLPPLCMPKRLLRALWNRLKYAAAVRSGNHIVTVSEASREELRQYYPALLSQPVEVIPNAWQHIERVTETPDLFERYAYLKDGEYWYSLSSQEPHKNLEWILRAAKQNPGEQFVLSGKKDRLEHGRHNGPELPENLILTGYVSDEDAKALMHHARGFLLPSYFEGFGIPPMEAIAAGAPRVLISDIPVLHEVYGSAALYLDPKDPAPVLTGKMPDPLEREAVLRRYSWSASAEKLLRILRHEAAAPAGDTNTALPGDTDAAPACDADKVPNRDGKEPVHE